MYYGKILCMARGYLIALYMQVARLGHMTSNAYYREQVSKLLDIFWIPVMFIIHCSYILIYRLTV